MRVRSRLASVFLALAGLGASAAAAQAALVVPDGGFVVHGSPAQVRAGIDVAHDAGARWISLGTSWSLLEPQPDSYLTPGGAGTAAWNDLEGELTYARSRGMNVELRFADAPSWASGKSGVTNDPPTPANVPGYGDFLADVARRFGPYLDAYSPWNEPNITRFWNPVDPVAFTALQKTAYTSIKAIDPTAIVLSAPIIGRYSSVNSGYPFLRAAYEAGLKGYADVIGWNGYPAGEPESPGAVDGGVPAGNTLPAQLYLRSLIDQYDPGRKVWIMETGWSTCASCDVSAANGVTEAQQADYLTRAFAYRRRYLTGVTERVFWYQLRDEGTNRSKWSENQGVVHSDLSPKPAFFAFRALGIDVPDPAPGNGTPLPGEGAITPVTLPPSAARLGLPSTARASTGGRLTIGRPKLSLKNGVFTLRFRVLVRGGTSVLRIDGFRSKRWRFVTSTHVKGSGTLSLRIRDKGFVGFRIRGTVPGLRGYRAGRLVRVPAKFLRVG